MGVSARKREVITLLLLSTLLCACSSTETKQSLCNSSNRHKDKRKSFVSGERWCIQNILYMDSMYYPAEEKELRA